MRDLDRGEDEANRRAIGALVGAYEMLSDPDRGVEMEATIKLFHLVAHVEGDEYARGWIARLADHIRQEARGSR